MKNDKNLALLSEAAGGRMQMQCTARSVLRFEMLQQ